MRNCCPRLILSAALVTCSLSSLVFFFELFLSLALPFSPDFFFWVLKWSSVGLFGYKEVRGGYASSFLTYVSFSYVFTAQVPDDEQFVPDFQSDSCEYLLSVVLFYVSPKQKLWLLFDILAALRQIFSPLKSQIHTFCFEKGVLILFEWLSLTTCTVQPSFINISSSCRGQTLFSVFKTQLWERLLYPSLPPFWV